VPLTGQPGSRASGRAFLTALNNAILEVTFVAFGPMTEERFFASVQERAPNDRRLFQQVPALHGIAKLS
jgi:hypothetical protein